MTAAVVPCGERLHWIRGQRLCESSPCGRHAVASNFETGANLSRDAHNAARGIARVRDECLCSRAAAHMACLAEPSDILTRTGAASARLRRPRVSGRGGHSRPEEHNVGAVEAGGWPLDATWSRSFIL